MVAASTSSAVHTNFTIDKFDKNITSWSRWVQRLEGAFDVFEIAEDKKLHFLLHYMGQDSFDLVCDKVAPLSPYEKLYDEVKNLLQDHYNPAPLEIMENYRFHMRKQKDDETVQDFLSSLRRLSIHCGFGNYLSTALRNQFVFGLRSERIQSRLLEMPNLTLEKATQLATSLELSIKDAAQLHSKPATAMMVNQFHHNNTNKGNKSKRRDGNTNAKGTNTNTNTTATPATTTNTVRKCYRCAATDHLANTCKYKDSVCNYCNVKGHLKSACMKKKSNNNHQAHAINIVDEVFHTSSLDIFQLNDNYCSKILVDLFIDNIRMNFEMDTGSPVSIISLRQKQAYFANSKIFPTNLKLSTYCGTALKVVGLIEVDVKFEHKKQRLQLYVIDADRHALLGRDWIRKLDVDLNKFMITSVDSLNSATITLDPQIQSIIKKYFVVFGESAGKITGASATISLKSDARPVFIRARQVPFAIKPLVERELDELVTKGIFEKVDHSQWATPLVPVIKPNGSIRLCGDYKVTVNPNLNVDEHPLPTIDELFSSMVGGQKFSKIDLAKAYLQMEVRSEDRSILTLSTHKGLFRPTRLMYGIASAPAIWQRQMEIILQGIEGVSVFLDDIKITGPDDSTHLSRLEEVLKRLAKHNMRVNAAKCEFFASSIDYCGYRIDSEGIHKQRKRVDAICDMRRPSNVDEVRAFVGVVNYYGRFLKNLSSEIYPLNNLLKKEVSFKWNRNCENAFVKVKDNLKSDEFLVHYDTNLPLVLATDASSYGVGAVLSHVFPDGSERPIQYASQTLSFTQQKYTQLDKEAYAIIFGVRKFAQYLIGRKFTLQVDNKPLSQILSPSKGLPTFAAMRMQHYELFLRNFNYDVVFVKRAIIVMQIFCHVCQLMFHCLHFSWKKLMLWK